MSVITIRRAHKWIAVSVAAFFLAWLASGILMAVPRNWLARGNARNTSASAAARPDFADIRVSIPQALVALEATSGERRRVTGVKVTRFAGTLAYHISLENDESRLIDALTGEPIVVSQALAEELARAASPGAGEPASTRLLAKRDFYYWGAVPVYKVGFADALGTVVYVSAVTAETQRWNHLFRVRRWIVSLHGFEPLKLITENETLRVSLLLISAVVGVGAVLTGLTLALPGRSPSSSGAKPGTRAP